MKIKTRKKLIMVYSRNNRNKAVTDKFTKSDIIKIQKLKTQKSYILIMPQYDGLNNNKK